MTKAGFASQYAFNLMVHAKIDMKTGLKINTW